MKVLTGWQLLGAIWKETTRKNVREFLQICYNQNADITHCSKMKFSIKDFSSKCDKILRKLRIWWHLLKQYLMENFIFCAATLLETCVIISTTYPVVTLECTLHLIQNLLADRDERHRTPGYFFFKTLLDCS